MANSAAVGRAIRQDLSKTLRDVMLHAAYAVAAATPVDTHHAESNWILSTGHPYLGVDGSREAVSFAQQQLGIAKIQAYDVGKHGPIYLRNNVHYVQFLDRGWSSQAPPGFVAEALQEAAQVARRGHKTRARRMLRRMAREAYRRGV